MLVLLLSLNHIHPIMEPIGTVLCGQFYKCSTIVNYDCRVVVYLGKFLIIATLEL